MHKDLENAIANDNLVLFVGAGMSIPLGFPNWNKLIIEILKDLQEELGESPTKFPFSYYKDLGNKIDVFEVLDDLERCNLKQRVEKILYAKINTIDFSSKSLEKHEKLWQISSKIITTNYDKVLEKVKPAHIEAYSNKNVFQQGRSLQGSPYLYKIHGDISDPESCILFSSDYEKLYSDENPNRETLKYFFMGKTVFFLGFSLEDPFVKKQLDYIHDLYKGYTKTHFLISKGNKNLSALNINTISIDNWDEAFDKKLDELIVLKEKIQPIVPSTKIEEDTVNIATETDLVKLKNIFEQKKKELEDVGELEMKKAFVEISKIKERIQELQTKELDFQQLIPDHNQQKLEYIFEEIFKAEKLPSKLIQDINDVREQHSEKNEWYHRSVLVSALACSIVNSKKLDPRKLDLLIDFTNDSEDKVWQKAITYLFLVLNHIENKWIRYKGVLKPKLKGLQEKPEIQEALKAIISFMQFGLQGVSLVNEKIFENEYFKDSPFNYFLPFYKDNPSVENVYDDDTIVDVENHIKFLYNVPLSDAFKYLLCNTENIHEKGKVQETKEEELESRIMIRNMLSIHHAFEPYLNYVNDFLNFYQNYPKSLKEIKQEITVIKITKLKNILLNTVEEHRVLARQFGLQKEWGKAITHYEALLKIKEKDKSALMNLIQCYGKVDKNDEDKLKIRLQIEKLITKDHKNLREISLIYNKKKKYKLALNYINKAIGFNNKEAIYYNTRGNFKSILKKYKDSLLDYDKAIGLDDKKAIYYHNRAGSKADLKDYEGALLDYDKAIGLDEKNADYYYNRGISKDCLKNYEGALLDYDKAIKLDNTDSDYYLKKASVFRRTGNFTKAHQVCNKVSELGIDDGRDIGTKATIYATEGQEELFYQYLEKAFKAKAKASWLEDDIKEKYKDEKRFQELLAKYNQTLEDED